VWRSLFASMRTFLLLVVAGAALCGSVSAKTTSEELMEVQQKVMELMGAQTASGAMLQDQSTAHAGQGVSNAHVEAFEQILQILYRMRDKVKDQVESALEEKKTAQQSVQVLEEKVEQLSDNMPMLETLISMVERMKESRFSQPNSRENPHTDCREIKSVFPSSPSGTYWVTGYQATKDKAYKVYCDMERDGGGWTLVLKTWYQAPNMYRNRAAVGEADDATTGKGSPFKLSDESIKALIGPTNNFDVMADQIGYNPSQSHGNYEFVVLRDYTGEWTYEKAMAPSTSPTKFQSYRSSDGELAWSGNLKCGVGGAGINCHNLIDNSKNPAGGNGCSIRLGYQGGADQHHFFMGATNSDTYLYVCNGAQHSSGNNMVHRFFLRARSPADE